MRRSHICYSQYSQIVIVQSVAQLLQYDNYCDTADYYRWDNNHKIFIATRMHWTLFPRDCQVSPNTHLILKTIYCPEIKFDK